MASEHMSIELFLAKRRGWKVADHTATVGLGPAGWRAVVRAHAQPHRTFERFHIAIVDPSGMAQHTHLAGTVAEAVKVAEAHVRAKRGAGKRAPAKPPAAKRAAARSPAAKSAAAKRAAA